MPPLTSLPTVATPNGLKTAAVPAILIDPDGNYVPAGGGGTGGDATAANQTIQITAEQAILAKIIAAPATAANQATEIASLASIDTKVGSATPAGANLIGKVNIQGNPGTLADKSGTITLGGTAQTAIALNANRNGFMIQNQSTGNLYFSSLAPAIVGQPSMQLSPGQSYETPANGFGIGAISIIGATTGQAYAAREW